MKKKTLIRTIALFVLAGLIVSIGIALYMFNMPHRDIQSAKVDYRLSNSEIVAEYLTDRDAANQKYLAADGDSKILEITGPVAKISENFDGNKVLLLKSPDDSAGVQATFTSETSKHIKALSAGQTVTVKGVIRSGASYDEDLGLYEHVILEKSDLIQK